MNLVIVESPAKAKTIEKFLGDQFQVRSSFGHIRDLPKSEMGIDVENDYEPNYVIPEDKKVVGELRKLSKKADMVWLASDEDREGEAIAWHLYESLNLEADKTKRIVFHEITKTAITNAVKNPREIDYDLVNAQQARRILDRLVGYELSPVLWKKIKPGLSAGRVQSVSVRLIVEREREIQGFKTESSFRVVGVFEADGKKFKAELSKRLTDEASANKVLESLRNVSFKVDSVQTKPAKRTPAAPFTTSTLQQEASRKLGLSVSRTMQLAQRLYEQGKITYMRTDSVNLSELAVGTAKAEIISSFGEEYSQSRQFKSKTKGAQEAHEAIRPTSMESRTSGDSETDKLYQLIWKRTLASQMADAKLERTTATIVDENNSVQFVGKGEVILFDGFLKVYLEGKDDEEEEADGLLPAMSQGQTLNCTSVTATERFTQHPARYTEASLVRKMEELGIGRPSTYAPTISTIINRNYVAKEQRDGTERHYKELTLIGGEIANKDLTEITGKEKNKLFPTDIGMVVTDFLLENFENILDYNFTADVERRFDEIAEGQLKWVNMIDAFYQPFHENILDTTENAERAKGHRVLGTDADSGKPISVRIGRFGPMAQIGEVEDEEKPKFASLLTGQRIDTITLEEALELFKFPKNLGDYESEEVIISQGRFGPYVKYKEMFVSLPKGEEMGAVDLDRAVELIKEKVAADAPIAEYESLPVQKGVGRFGPFIKWNGMFINVNKKYDYDNLTFENITELIEDKKRKEIEKYIHRWDDEGISVQKARWGRFNVIKGKTKIELPKGTKVEEYTLEDVKKMIEEKEKKKPAKKKKAVAKKK
jgi:DNA topoisomerase-1